MPTYRQISLTVLECKALWLIADAGYCEPFPELDSDPALDAAAMSALDKVWRADKGMGRRPTPPNNPKRGPNLDLTRRPRPAA